jgi:hypothetical protein
MKDGSSDRHVRPLLNGRFRNSQTPRRTLRRLSQVFFVIAAVLGVFLILGPRSMTDGRAPSGDKGRFAETLNHAPASKTVASAKRHGESPISVRARKTHLQGRRVGRRPHAGIQSARPRAKRPASRPKRSRVLVTGLSLPHRSDIANTNVAHARPVGTEHLPRPDADDLSRP